MNSSGSKLNLLEQLNVKAFCQFASYYDGSLYQFSVENEDTLSIQSLDNVSKKLCVIVARNLYTEQNKEYPVDSLSELKKILKLEYSNQPNVRYHIWEIKDGKASVNIWQFHNTVPSATCLIPESLLYASASEQSSNNKVIVSLLNNRETFVGKQGLGIVSTLTSPVISTAEQFAMASGITFEPNQSNESVFTDSEREQYALSMLLKGAKNLSWSTLFSLCKPVEKIDKTKSIQLVFIPIFIIVFVYLGLSSAFLSYQHYSLTQSLKQHSQNVSSALQLQTEVDGKMLRYNELKQFLKQQRNYSPAWLPILELVPKSQFRNIQTAGERIILRGSTEDAVILLEELTNHALVKEAKFDFPVRKNRNRDTFVLSFTLSQNVETNKKQDINKPQDKGGQNG